ncbi:hypothetical protein ABT120_53400 [Nonomuraea angiospora]|uniref:hypothetical protein n=1 Tax=Nonomuraea angiospora TaxID=46172 RepID=UPI00331DCFFF
MTIALDLGFNGTGLTKRPKPAPYLPALDTLDRERHAAPPAVSIEVPGHYRPWFADHIVHEVSRLLALHAGWDGRRAKPITRAAVEATVATLFRIMDVQSAPAQFFPLVDGGIQIGWLANGDSIEIEIDAKGDPWVLATTADGATVVEGELTATSSETFTKLRNFLKILSGRIAAAH